MTNQWEDPKKNLTMLTEDIEEEDTEETTTLEILEIGATVNYETIIIIHNLANKSVKEKEFSSSTPNKSDQAPLKVYTSKFPYPQRLCKGKIKKRYAKFIDMIKEVRINVPLIDVLAGMANYRKFLKDLVSNKSKIKQISVAFLNKECITVVQNKLPPKLGVGDDRITFLIDKAMQHSHSNDDTCFRMDVINEVTEEELDALLNDYEPFLSTSEKINETSLDKEFKEFMVIDEIVEQEEEVDDNSEELPLEEKLRIKPSI
ncbi:hypothetical protein Tco_1300463 [Tanacetum coccineum]